MGAKLKDKIATIILYMISLFVLILLVSLISFIIYQGRESLNYKFLTSNPKFGQTGGGIAPQLFNSFYLLIVSLIITVPIGIGAGIYLAEYAKEGRFLEIIRLSIETLASVPSIVVGLFGLLIFVRITGGYNLISGALAITVLNLPAMTRVCENSIKSIKGGIKEASLGLGATKWQTIRRVILPSALPQILTGIILAAGRIFGEAAALLYTAGMSAPILRFNNISLTNRSSAFSLFKPSETLAVYIWKLNSEATAPDASKIAAGASAVLVIMVLLFNIIARFLGKKIHERYTGAK